MTETSYQKIHAPLSWNTEYVAATYSVTKPQYQYNNYNTLVCNIRSQSLSLFCRTLNNKNHVLQSYFSGRQRSEYNLKTITYIKELITETSELNNVHFFLFFGMFVL